MSDKTSKKRQLISGANAAVVIVATVGIAVALNAIASQVFARADLTANQIYTLSDASVEAAKNFDDPVHVKAFISPDMPAPLNNLRQSVGDTLAEYAAVSDGKLTYEIISPADSDHIEEDAKSFGCQKVPIGQQTKDKVSMQMVYKCVAFSHGDDLEVVSDLKAAKNQSLANFEYQFTKSLLNLAETDTRKLGFVAGFGGPVSSPQFLGSIQSTFNRLYGDLISATKVDLSADDPTIPDDVEALVVLNADQTFSDEAIFALDQFVQQGGSLGWYQSATGVNQRLQQKMMGRMGAGRAPSIRQPLDPDLSRLFDAYGLHLRQDIVLDPDHGVRSMAVAQGKLVQLKQPATFIMQDVDRSLPFMQHISALALPAAATIDITSAALGDENIEAHKVIQTPEGALRRPKPPTSFNYRTFSERDSSEKPGKWTVAAAVEGDLPSFYDSADHSLPDGHTGADLAQEAAPARVLVVGSGDFFQPNRQLGYNQRLASLGGQFLISSMEWLVQDTALTQIRSKAMPRLLGDVATTTEHELQFVNIAAVPAIFALFGALMMIRRRRRKEALDRSQADADI